MNKQKMLFHKKKFKKTNEQMDIEEVSNQNTRG